ncbi:metal-binding protein ZinT [Paracoccus cavernae]|uniref:metal-binding protein ZinT n=1 Tax=Paracoccus cavernae TaxID=1571207 RepID=UPI003644AD1D
MRPDLGDGGVLSTLALLPLAAQEAAPKDHAHDHSHDHAHDHGHSHTGTQTETPAGGRAAEIAKGYFADDEVKPRVLGDWEGEWQSVYPYLQDGTLDPVMAHKAAQGDKTAAEHRATYEAGYRTDTDRIVIAGDEVAFTTQGTTRRATYRSDGFEILTYAKGNRGVRFVFAKVAGDEGTPAFIQFSDHIIAPQKAGHYHLYWGDDRAALLAEVEHWPTYYPAAMDGAQIREEMMAH